MAVEPTDEDGPGILRRFILPGLFVIALFVALFLRSGSPELAVIQGETMGTTYTAKVAGTTDEEQISLGAAVDEALESVNARMSTYRSDSELMKLNAAPTGEAIKISRELFEVLDAAQTVSAASSGAFDITVGPIVNAYGFGPGAKRDPPTESELEVLKRSVGFQNVELDADASTATKRVDGLFLDLSAIAKGYGVDRAAAAIESLGFENYMVEVGGEVRTRGVNDEGEPWRLGIETPKTDAREIQRVVELNDQSLATSGDYRNYYEKDGVRISHTIDARTGKPIKHRLASVSVLHSTCMEADAWATALSVLGEKEGLELAEELGLAALFIVRSGDGFEEIETSAFKSARK